MLAPSIFAVVAAAIKKELEPQGFHVHVDTNHGEIVLSEVVNPDNHLVWIVGIKSGPHTRTLN